MSSSFESLTKDFESLSEEEKEKLYLFVAKRADETYQQKAVQVLEDTLNKFKTYFKYWTDEQKKQFEIYFPTVTEKRRGSSATEFKYRIKFNGKTVDAPSKGALKKDFSEWAKSAEGKAYFDEMAKARPSFDFKNKNGTPLRGYPLHPDYVKKHGVTFEPDTALVGKVFTEFTNKNKNTPSPFPKQFLEEEKEKVVEAENEPAPKKTK